MNDPTQPVAAGTVAEPEKPFVVRMTREQWRKTHRDFKGIIDGQKTVLTFIPHQGTGIAPVEIID